jgi:hypothetical protein
MFVLLVDQSLEPLLHHVLHPDLAGDHRSRGELSYMFVSIASTNRAPQKEGTYLMRLHR